MENADKLTHEEMEEAISHSGYLLEQRVRQRMEYEGLWVETNYAFADPITGKSREIDILGTTYENIYGENSHLEWVVMAECENNEKPIVFFESKDAIPEMQIDSIKYSGVPMKLRTKDGITTIPRVLKLEQFHHYCTEKFATQYCTFRMPKEKGSKWLAYHNDEQHDTINSLISAADYERKHFHEMVKSSVGRGVKGVTLKFLYPVVIFQGQILKATFSGNENNVQLSEVNHVLFRRNLWVSGERLEYTIDMVQENYIESFVKLFYDEMDKTLEHMHNQKNAIEGAMDLILKEHRNSKTMNLLQKWFS